jgi:4-amino-4-deoxy-L-arabinose transferase-like glycosyltransferase
MKGEWWARHNPPQKISARLANVLMILVLLIAAWLRFWQLNAIPPGLWFDEAYLALDAARMLQTGDWPVFFVGNQGYEPLFNYLLALSFTVWGQTIYAIRLVPAFVGVLSVAMMYRWALALFKPQHQAQWLALVSAAGLAVSFWFLTMNRIGYRANLLLIFVAATTYFFWRGWQTDQWRYYLLTGVVLGLAQYTYFSARLLPLVFILFLVLQTLLYWRNRQVKNILQWPRPPNLRSNWLGLLIVGGVSFLVALPLLIFAFNHPQIFWERTKDVALKADGVAVWAKLGGQLLEALRVFTDGQDPNWRHHLLGQPVFDVLNTIGFFLGLLVALRYLRQPVYQFLYCLLLMMWLPALLSEPVFHTLRLSGMLPAYYALMALGLIHSLLWLSQCIPTRWLLRSSTAGLVALLLVLLVSGGLTVFNYFYRWARLDEVYAAFDGPVVELMNQLTAAPEVNVLIPYYLYTQASMRYLLQPQFQEEVLLPVAAVTQLSQSPHPTLVIPEYPPDDRLPPAYVWLIRDKTGPGVAYVSAVRRDKPARVLAQAEVDSLKGSRNNNIAHRYAVNPAETLDLFLAQLPTRKAAIAWADNLRLVGYELTPPVIKPGESGMLVLAWDILGYTNLSEKMFIQWLDSRGRPVGQQEIEPISRKMYRWRDDGLILEQHPFNFKADLSPGLYFARLGFFNPQTGQRLLASSTDGQPVGDEFIVGPLYLSDTGQLPGPQQPIRARLGDHFELLGYTLSAGPDTATQVELFWQSLSPTDRNFTVFVQLLDPNNRIIAQADAQPLANIYPTSRWQPGDITSEQFTLPVAPSALANGATLVTGMYDLTTGARLPVYDQQGQLLHDGLVQLKD